MACNCIELSGKFRKNMLLSHIPFEFCPFCGKKYVEEEGDGVL
jgi:hypothetical protein